MKSLKSSTSNFLLVLSLCCGGLLASTFVTSPASAEVPASVKAGIEDAIDTVSELNGLSLAALTVALTPLGAMLTLRFLNMVLSRV